VRWSILGVVLALVLCFWVTRPDRAVGLTAAPVETVYITKTGKKYHASGCQYLSKSKIPIDKDKAIERGYTACSKCNP
jgi:hypothetical protein